MKIVIVIAIFLLNSEFLLAQEFTPTLEHWDSNTLQQIKKVSFNSRCSEKSNLVVFYGNLARTDGKKFISDVLKPYLENTGDTSYTSYLQSLIKQLTNQKKLPLLQHDTELANMAKHYATKAGRKGIVGHHQFNQRFKALIKKEKIVAENCSYGEETALGVVIQLLIDDGIKKLGHRFNILSPAFKYIGVGFAPHKQYGINCVQEFSD